MKRLVSLAAVLGLVAGSVMAEYRPSPEVEARCRLALTTPIAHAAPGYNPQFKHLLADAMLAGPQENLMLVGGSRSGKTFTLCKAVAGRAIRTMQQDFTRQAILRLHLKDIAESIGMDTWPKMMRLRYPGVGYRHHSRNSGGWITINCKTRPRQDWPEIWLLGLDDKERVDKVLGKEFCTLYYNECSQISYSAILTSQSRLALRVPGIRNRVYYDLNPVGTGHFTYSLFIEGRKPGGLEALPDPENYVYMYMNPLDNEANVADGYIDRLRAMPEQSRKRFFEGRYVAQLPGALWTLEGIEILRRQPGDPLIPTFERIVVAVDPSGASGEMDEKADEIGLVVMALGTDGHVYLLEDQTGLYAPERWGRIAVELYFKWKADRIIGEKNFGGDMVRAVIQGARIDDKPIGQNVPYRHVDASRGKSVRAEPISAMHDRGMIHHVGEFPLLERELTNFTAAGYKGSKSPNRADAFVWGATELFGNNLPYGLTTYLQERQAEIDKDREAKMSSMVEKLAAGSNLNKVETVPAEAKEPTKGGCPNCGALCIQNVATGGKRCGNCGTQFNIPVLDLKPFNRSSLYK